MSFLLFIIILVLVFRVFGPRLLGWFAARQQRRVEQWLRDRFGGASTFGDRAGSGYGARSASGQGGRRAKVYGPDEGEYVEFEDIVEAGEVHVEAQGDNGTDKGSRYKPGDNVTDAEFEDLP